MTLKNYLVKYKSYEAISYTNGQIQKFSDEIVVEGALQININGVPYTVVMRTPGNDFDLIRGLLYAEDIYKKKEKPEFKIIEEKPNGFSVINVIIPQNELGKGYLNKRTLLSVSSCGICGKQDLDAISIKGEKIYSKKNLNNIDLETKFDLLKKNQQLFKKTGGSHAAGIFSTNNETIAIAEDIGRHNAVDKVIGNYLNENSDKQPQFLIVSGRVSYEIVSKAFIAKIPIIAAVSACSSIAIDYAKEFGITLIGFSRNKKHTIYA